MSLLIGLHIQEQLSKNEKVMAKVKDRIYPVVATQGAPAYPFIIFDSAVTGAEESKDGYVDETAQVQIAVFGKSYGDAVRIAHEVRRTLSRGVADYADFSVVESRFVGSNEDYSDDLQAYIINLSFEFITV